MEEVRSTLSQPVDPGGVGGFYYSYVYSYSYVLIVTYDFFYIYIYMYISVWLPGANPTFRFFLGPRGVIFPKYEPVSCHSDLIQVQLSTTIFVSIFTLKFHTQTAFLLLC